MRLIKILLVSICTVAIAGSGWSQPDNSNEGPGILGYFDPSTRVFQPLMRPAVSPNAFSTFTGQFVINFTIAVSSAIAGTQPITCGVDASVIDENRTFSNYVSESASAIAAHSGNFAKCRVAFAYSWRLANAKTDTVTLSYYISTYVTSTPTLKQLSSRNASQWIDVLPIPANGSTTTKSVSATL